MLYTQEVNCLFLYCAYGLKIEQDFLDIQYTHKDVSQQNKRNGIVHFRSLSKDLHMKSRKTKSLTKKISISLAIHSSSTLLQYKIMLQFPRL